MKRRDKRTISFLSKRMDPRTTYCKDILSIWLLKKKKKDDKNEKNSEAGKSVVLRSITARC